MDIVNYVTISLEEIMLHDPRELGAVQGSFLDDEDSSVVDGGGPSLSFVWGVFKESNTAAKLILPDSISTPFYLPSPRITKADKDAHFEKELRRLNFIYERDRKYVPPSDRKSAIMNSIPDYALRGRERMIEKRLLDQYRQDPEKREEFIRTALGKEAANEPLTQKVQKKPKPPQQPPVAKEVRHTVVQQRRTVLLATVQENIADYGLKMEEKRRKVQDTMQLQQTQLSRARTERWLQIVSAVNCLRILYGSVSAMRRLKAQSPQRWNACMKIQRWFRRLALFKMKSSLHTGRPHQTSSIVKMLRDAALKAGGPRCQIAQRQQACTVITSFLQELQGRMSVYVRKFISKIKNLQRYVKRHVANNSLRVSLLGRLLEACLPAMILHMEVVQQGRGHDLHNLSSFDLNKLGSVDRHAARLSLVRQMNTAAFHAYLRSHTSQLARVVAVFKSYGARTSRNIDLAQAELVDLLQRKRRIHIINTERAKEVQLKIPKFGMDDIKTFIQGGEDPLRNYLQEAQDEQEERHAANVTARAGKGRGRGWPHQPQQTMLLLRSVELEDVAFVAMSVAAMFNPPAPQGMQRPSMRSAPVALSDAVSLAPSSAPGSAGAVPSILLRVGSNSSESDHTERQQSRGASGFAQGSRSGGRQPRVSLLVSTQRARASKITHDSPSAKAASTQQVPPSPRADPSNDALRPASPVQREGVAGSHLGQSPQKGRRLSSTRAAAAVGILGFQLKK